MVVDSGVLEGGGCWVMYTIENNLLHLQLGDQPSRDFCTSCRDGNPDSWCRFFSNRLQQKLIKMPYQMRRVAAGGGRPSRQLVHICFKAFKTNVHQLSGWPPPPPPPSSTGNAFYLIFDVIH